uniref:Secreted protein n=1 Tax=Hucho hucho TaxID=62062 RepID=A0A4W5K1U7_9TELE
MNCCLLFQCSCLNVFLLLGLLQLCNCVWIKLSQCYTDLNLGKVLILHLSQTLSPTPFPVWRRERECFDGWVYLCLFHLGDLFGALEFPFLLSPRFHSGCCASALLGFFLLLASVKLKSGLPLEHCGVWIFLSKVFATCLSPLVFNIEVNMPSFCCVFFSHVGEALLVYSENTSHVR